MAKIVESYRSTPALHRLVRRAAKMESKSPSDFLREAAEEKAKAVLAAGAREQLHAMLGKLPTGRASSNKAAERLGEEVARASRTSRK